MTKNLDVFGEIASWSIEALDEDITRYFYRFSAVSLIETGQKNYVIGRKGTGKTAIAEYIRNKESNSRLLSFKNFPFNTIYDKKDNNFTSPNQYITIWEYVIYCSICNMMINDKAVDPLRRKELSKLFDVDLENALAQSIGKLSDRGFNLSILGVGGGFTQKNTTNSGMSIEKKNEILKQYIISNISHNSYFVIFDALDEDYKGVLQPDRKEIYFELLISLFKAVQNVRRAFQNTSIVPLVFLRNDIFDLCRDPDKNKWLDRAIVLNWSIDNLKSLIGYRLSKAVSAEAFAVPFADIWGDFFASKVRVGKHQRFEDSFAYMLRSTYWRPRDVISYVRECAKLAHNRDTEFVTGAMIKEASAGHSDYLRREVIDESYSIIDNISEILDLLSEQRKSIFTQKEFAELYDEAFPNRENSDKSYTLKSDEVLKLLYHFNVVGNIARGSNHQVYAFSSNNKKLNPRENICIHVGLLKALDIA